MHVLVVSAALWLFVMYVVMPIAQFIAAYWPWLLAGIVSLLVLAIYLGYRDLKASFPNPAKVHPNKGNEVLGTLQHSALTRKPVNPRYGGLLQTVGSHTAASSGVPTRGLVIMEEPLKQILQGRKTMELRSKHNRQLGPVALIMKGTGKVYAVANIVDSIGPMSFEEFRAESWRHAVEPERMREIHARWNIGWVLNGLVVLLEPVPYVHKGMSQVKLNQQAIDGIARQLALSHSRTRSRSSLP